MSDLGDYGWDGYGPAAEDSLASDFAQYLYVTLADDGFDVRPCENSTCLDVLVQRGSAVRSMSLTQDDQVVRLSVAEVDDD